MKQEVFLECAMAVGDSNDEALGRGVLHHHRRAAADDSVPSDVLLDTPQDTPIGTPCSGFLAMGKLPTIVH